MPDMDLVTFAADRLRDLDDIAAMLRPELTAAIGNEELTDAERSDEIIDAAAAAYEVVFSEVGNGGSMGVGLSRFVSDIRSAVRRLEPDGTEAQVDRMVNWLATATLGAATFHSGTRGQRKTWITMLDADVRDTHEALHGVDVPINGRFTVETTPRARPQYPGQPVGPVEAWINCRCVLFVDAALTAAVEPDEDELDAIEEELESEDEEQRDLRTDEDLQWHAVIAPLGVRSGDGRTFAELDWRDLPLPLEWQRITASEHDGSIIVGSQQQMAVVDGELRAAGVFVDNDESDEVIGRIADGSLRSVSVQIDNHTTALDEDEQGVTYTGRVCATTIVNVGAFPECWIKLGPPPEGFLGGEPLVAAISDKPWDGSAERFTPEQWKRSTIIHVCDGDEKSCHKLPIREPDGALSRAGVHAAAARLNQVNAPPEAIASAKSKLRGAYRELEEEAPDVVASLEDDATFKRGAGWLTNPEETKRLHTYWTRGEGAAKIRWGTNGDFTRCTRQLRKYIEPRFLNRTCAQWHYDALGYWPGELGKPGNPPDTPENRQRARRHANSEDDIMANATIVNHSHSVNAPSFIAAAATPQRVIKRTWFDNPGLDGPTPLTVQRDGRLFGHLATWGTCHLGYDECVEAPHSETDYAYMHTGVVDTDEGEIACGVLTMDTGHADPYASMNKTVDHYDSTGTQVAKVRCGEDAFGIWVAGAMDILGEDDMARFKAASISGDWRNVGGNLELVAGLMVNVPGFPIPRPSLAASGARQLSLVAANVVRHDGVDAEGVADTVIRKLDERDRRRARLASLQPVRADAETRHAEKRAERLARLMAVVES